MVDMKRGSVGLWFSFALAIFLLSLWIGSMLGSSAAKYWYGNRQPGEGRLLGPERNRVESELADLSAVQTLQLFARIAPNEVEPQDKLLSDEIKGLEQIKRRSNVQEVRSLVDSISDLPTWTLQCKTDKMITKSWRRLICSRRRFYSSLWAGGTTQRECLK